MLSRSFDSSTDEEVSYLHDVSEPRTAAPANSLQDDVERLLDIAGQLFTAIERQIHRMEEELVRDLGEEVRAQTQTVFKERLIRCAECLDKSIREIGLHLEQRASEHIVNYDLRDNP
jgi:hypothetical protein